MFEPGDPQPLVVTARGLPDVAALEAAAPADAEAVGDPLELAKTINRYARIAQALEQEAAEVDPDVFITLQDRDASLLQARLAEEAEAGGREFETVPLPAGGLEVKFEPGLGDVWGWAKSLFDWIDRKKAHPIVRPPSDDFEPLPNSARIGILSDCYGPFSGAHELNVASAELPLIERGAKLLGRTPSDGVGPVIVAGRRVELIVGCVAGTGDVIPEARRLVEEGRAQAIIGPEDPGQGMSFR